MLFFLVLLAIAQISIACDGPNEFENLCYSPCETTCATRFRNNRRCPDVCSIGCSCRRGYLRNDDGVCVLSGQCSAPICNSDEEYKECGTNCELNCDNFDEQVICTKDCNPGCFCKGSTVREFSGSLKCVARNSCAV